MKKIELYYIFFVLQFIIIERIFIKLLQKVNTSFYAYLFYICIYIYIYIYIIDKKVKSIVALFI
jgi:hypothetical protein